MIIQSLGFEFLKLVKIIQLQEFGVGAEHTESRMVPPGREYVRTLSCVPASRGQGNLYFLNFCLPVSRSRKVTIVFSHLPPSICDLFIYWRGVGGVRRQYVARNPTKRSPSNDWNRTQFKRAEKVKLFDLLTFSAHFQTFVHRCFFLGSIMYRFIEVSVHTRGSPFSIQSAAVISRARRWIPRSSTILPSTSPSE